MYYHIYNRGAHKAPIFADGKDRERMLALLYIANRSEPFNIIRFKGQNIFKVEKADSLVDIVAYCLMPNHIHIAVKAENGEKVTKFIHKLSTGYGAYYNLKHHHSGTIWQG